MATRGTVLKYFVSSVSTDMAEYREAACEAVRAAGHRPVEMREFKASGKTPEEYVKDQVKKCDAYIGILGYCYGHSPTGDDRSFTQLEYETAQQLCLPCLMFVASDDIEGKLELVAVDPRSADQISFRNAVQQAHACRTFRSTDELRLEVLKSIADLDTDRPKVDCYVLCGGTASRLWPLTRDYCKVLLPVAGRPVLAHVIDFIDACGEIDKVYLITGSQWKKDIDAFKRSAHCGLACRVIVEDKDRKKAQARLGPIGALDEAIRQTNRKPGDIVVLGADNLFSFQLSAFVRFAQEHGTTANAFHSIQTDYDAREYGVAEISPQGSVRKFKEKQSIPAIVNISTACYYFDRSAVEAMPGYLRGGGDPFSLGAFIHWLIANDHPVSGAKFPEPWYDIGTLAELLKANAHHLTNDRRGILPARSRMKGKVQIAAGATVENSTLGPNAYVGSDATIVDSTVRNSIIMQGTKITNAHVEDSIVGPGSTVEGHLARAVVGRNAHILTGHV